MFFFKNLRGGSDHMLDPITKKMTDESNGNGFCFTFYCDICASPWHSIPYSGGRGRGAEVHTWENEHAAAYERANREALMHFNRCPVCKRMVCDDCFSILDEQDMCKECADARKR